MIGQTVGGYRIVSRLGAGGMGEVYVGEHTRIDRRVAVKVLLPELSVRTEMVGRFFAEARATSSIRHPGIVEVFDCDVQPGGRAFIVMELLEGESLMARLNRDRGFGREERTALGVAAEIADAVGAAHRKNIVHRDLKPDNVFLTRDMRAPAGFVVKILDFGIAKLLVADSRSGAVAARTQTGALMGTPIYMSPEQCRGASAVDCRADIYSLGCILFELLAERPPFIYEGFGELIAAHLGEKPVALRSLRPQIAPAVEALVARLLEKDPARRPQTMEEAGQEMAAVLVRAAGGPTRANIDRSRAGSVAGAPPITGGGAGRTQVAGAAFPGRASQTTFSAAAAEELTPPPRASRPKLWAAIAAFGVLGGAVAVISYRRNEAGAPAAATAEAPPPPPPAVPLGATVSLEVSDAPAGLTATVDGQAASLPLALPAGSAQHELVFHAPGFRERTLHVDGRTSRILTLAMQAEEPAVKRPPVVATPPRPAPPAAAPPAEKRAHETATAHHRRAAQPAPLDLEDDARKL